MERKNPSDPIINANILKGKKKFEKVFGSNENPNLYIEPNSASSDLKDN
jgi:hypothetical protein